jgi:tetratricopeptide (TPR) repeat protein
VIAINLVDRWREQGVPSLSVVMIVKDEAGVLAECLASVRGIADEIVIGDTGSTDGTAEVAGRFGARVVPVEWRNDFAEARNAVLREARGDWLLHLDADEVLDREGAARVRAIVDQDGAGADAIEVTLANYCDAPRAWRWTPARPGDPCARGYSGYLPVGLLRLFRNGMGFHYREPVHENIMESVVEAGGVVRAEPIFIHHYGYVRETKTKGALYLEIAREKTRARPDDPKSWHDLAEQLVALDRAAEAEPAARRALELDPMHLAAATTLANVLLNRGELDEPKALFQRFESQGVAPPHVVTTLAAIAIRQGRVVEARERLERVVAGNPTALLARLYLARVRDLDGEPQRARAELLRAQELAPRLQETKDRLEAQALRRRSEEEMAQGLHKSALKSLVEALRRDPDDPLIHRGIGECLATLGQHEAAAKSLTRARVLAPSCVERR